LTGTATSLGLHAMTRFKRTSALNNNINLHFIFKFPLESLDCKTAHSSKESMSIESGRELFSGLQFEVKRTIFEGS